MSDLLESLNSGCGEQNIAGISSIQYVPVEWILTFPEFINTNNTITEQVALIVGKSWLSMFPVIETIDFRERQRDSSQAAFFTQSLKMDIAKDTNVKDYQFDIMRRHRFILIYTNRNGEQKLLGTPEYPFKFNSTLQSGRKPGDFSGHKIEFESQNPNKAPFYNP